MKAFLIGTILFCAIITFYGDATYGQGSRFGAKQESESLEYEDVNSDGEYVYYTVGSLSASKYYTYEPRGLHTSKLSSYAGSSFSLYTSNIPSYPFSMRAMLKIRGTGDTAKRNPAYSDANGSKKLKRMENGVAYVYAPATSKSVAKVKKFFSPIQEGSFSVSCWGRWETYMEYTVHPEDYTHLLSPYAEADVSVLEPNSVEPSSPVVDTN